MLLRENSASNDTVSTSHRFRSLRPSLSVDPKGAHNKLLRMGSGIFLLVFSIMVVVLDSSNFLAIGLPFLVLMDGLMLVMIGAVGGMDKPRYHFVARAFCRSKFLPKCI